MGGVGKDGFIGGICFNLFHASATAFACRLSPPGETNLLQLASSLVSV